MVLRYSDGRLPCRIREFTDYYPDVFDDGDGIKITYDKKAAFLENKDRIIINKIIPMIKDVLPYVQLYDESGNYLQTVFLSPLDVKTADYRIECPELYHAFYYDYWADYIAKHDFEIYDNGKSVTSLPEPDESVSEENAEIHNVKLLDKSGNTYQYDYDRKEIPFSKCLPDQQDDHKYHCD